MSTMKALLDDLSFIVCELLVFTFMLFFGCVFVVSVLFAVVVLIASITGLL